MAHRPVSNVILTVLCFISVLLGLGGLREHGIDHWYLFCSPLLLAAYLFGLRGALAGGLMSALSLGLLYKNAADTYQLLYATAEESLRQVYQNLELFRLPQADLTGSIVGWAVMVGGALVVGYLNDRQRLLEEQLRRMQTLDHLTGLPNRQHFIQTMRRWCAEPGQGQTLYALIIFDIDNFTALQSRYGHFSGDLVLQRTGQLLKAYMGKGMFVGRLGSDEFGVLVRSKLPGDVRECAEDIRAALSAFCWLGIEREGLEEPLTASFGVACHPAGSTSPAELLRAADNAMTLQKAQGGRGIRYASPEEKGLAGAIGHVPNSIHEWHEIAARLGPPVLH